jgi:hypothetical protein
VNDAIPEHSLFDVADFQVAPIFCDSISTVNCLRVGIFVAYNDALDILIEEDFPDFVFRNAMLEGVGDEA